MKGIIVDDINGKPLPFATLKARGTSQGTVTDVDGRFSWQLPEGIDSISASYLGYQPQSVAVRGPQGSVTIRLSPQTGMIGEVTVRPPYDKIKRLLNAAIARRSEHNPDMLQAYQCQIYYKMVADIDYTMFAEDSVEHEKMRSMNESQHFLESETYSRRFWQKPATLHEDVVATRFSGIPNAAFTNLVTNVLPFHAHGDFIKLNEAEYPNPIAKGYNTRYEFNLSDEFMDGTDTVWVLRFIPKAGISGLNGRVYLHSAGYAIYRLIAQAEEKGLGHITRIEQQYSRADGHWFPHRLNYVLDWKDPKTKGQTVMVTGTSRIDSVRYSLPAGYRFDKAHTTVLLPGAERVADSVWPHYRTDSFTAKDARTYKFNDSLGRKMHSERFLKIVAGLSDGRVPLKNFDIVLARVYSYNKYEGSRLGVGLQTNDDISKRFSIGGWAGYGFRDKALKWGGFAELYGDKYKETVLRIAYENDLRDPGRVELSPSLEQGFVRQYLIQRADAVRSFSALVRSKWGYLTASLEARAEDITPRYDYRFFQESVPARAFNATEAIIGLRYAYGEQTASAFGKYHAVATAYPVLYGSITSGWLSTDAPTAPVTQYLNAVGGIQWTKHVNRLGTERFLVLGGKSFSNRSLPLSKLFAGRGYRYDDVAAYSFGYLYTLRPYDVYTDAFVSAHWRHDFDFRLWKLPYSTPSVGLGYNILYGTLEQPEIHQGPAFMVPSRAYQEAGIVLNDLIRLKYLSTAYITVHAGYYQQLSTSATPNNGVSVLGLGVAL